MAATGSRRTPRLWQKVQEALRALDSPTTNVAIRDWILRHYPDTNTESIQAQIIICCVNHPSRVHHPENQRAREATDPRYDFLYRPGPGRVEWSLFESASPEDRRDLGELVPDAAID